MSVHSEFPHRQDISASRPPCTPLQRYGLMRGVMIRQRVNLQRVNPRRVLGT